MNYEKYMIRNSQVKDKLIAMLEHTKMVNLICDPWKKAIQLYNLKI